MLDSLEPQSAGATGDAGSRFDRGRRPLVACAVEPMVRIHPFSSFVSVVVAAMVPSCGTDSGGATSAQAGSAGASGSAGSGGSGAVPEVTASCAAICDKKRAAACAKDPPNTDCPGACISSYTAGSGAPCIREYAIEAACVAAGNVVCSVDQESTPVAPCGDERRALESCRAAGVGAGGAP